MHAGRQRLLGGFLLKAHHPCLYPRAEGPTPEKLKSCTAFLQLAASPAGGDAPTAKDYIS